jgi:hypothetical protein
MRGEVEIWDGDKLLHKESNLLVNGASELLAEVMTVSPSLSGTLDLDGNVVYTDLATSSILDASNYTIQAISFGTGSEAFKQNAHRSDGSVREANWLTYQGVLGTHGVHYYVYEPSSTHPFTGSNQGSYSPLVGLPIPPTPALNVLEENTSISAIVGGVEVSSVFPGNGQLTNFLPSGIFSSVMQNTPFSGVDGVSAYGAATTLGCFTEGSSVIYGTRGYGLYKKTNDDGSVAVSVFDTNTTNLNYLKGSFFNEVSSMDISGFVNMVMSGSPGTTTDYEMSSGASGLCVSGGHDLTNSGTVEYTIMIAADDVATANAYGGIYHLGLWTIDMNQSLRNGNTPPFGFSVLNNPRKYKLFARKGLSKNLCFVLDKASGSDRKGSKNYTDLTIKWRLHFI